MLIPYASETEREYEYSQIHAFAVLVLLAAMLAIHVWIHQTYSRQEWEDLVYRLGVVRWDLHWYSFLTCTFLHAGWLHLLGNGFFLWVYGAPLERLLGTARFIVLYVAGAFLSMAIHVATLSPFYADVPAIGASGAISAVLGAFFVLLPHAKLKCVLLVFFRPLLFTLPAWAVLGMWFAFQLYSSVGMSASESSIAFWAHVGGFAGGALAGTLLYKIKRRLEEAWQRRQVAELREGWNAYLAGDTPRAAGAVREQGSAAGIDTALEKAILAGAAADTADAAAPELLKAFDKARDKLDMNGVLTAYLQMLNRLPPRYISPSVHHEAGSAAVAARKPRFALQAFARYLEACEPSQADQVLSRCEAICRHGIGDAAAADRMAALRKSVARQAFRGLQ